MKCKDCGVDITDEEAEELDGRCYQCHRGSNPTFATFTVDDILSGRVFDGESDE